MENTAAKKHPSSLTSISVLTGGVFNNSQICSVIDMSSGCPVVFFFSPANNTGSNKRQITDLVDQSIQITTQCFVVTADNRYILVCGFWDKSFRVYSSETGRLQCKLYFL